MKKLIAFVKKYQLIILLALIASLLLGFKLFGSQKAEEVIPTLLPTPYPTKIPTKSPADTGDKGITEEEFVQNILNNFPLSPYLPYPDKNIAIRYIGPLKLEITIKVTTSAVTRQKILDWIHSKEIDPQTHEISWK